MKAGVKKIAIYVHKAISLIRLPFALLALPRTACVVRMGSTMDNTFGMLFDAVVIGAALYGAGCLQGYLYFRKYSESDPWYLQALVGCILVCDTFQVAILTACVYQYVISVRIIDSVPIITNSLIPDIQNFGNPNILDHMFKRHAHYRNFLQQRYRCHGADVLLLATLAPSFLVLLPLVSNRVAVWDDNCLTFIPSFVKELYSRKISLSMFVTVAVERKLCLFKCSLNFETYKELASLKNLSMSCNILTGAISTHITEMQASSLPRLTPASPRFASGFGYLDFGSYDTLSSQRQNLLQENK
ncbi:hypothetical protein D9757_003906 [Collybiopsis confluens]|uniref:Uncharacterized protein n=1 Tax=Collybiopsis confluens TaxID=2823264 RepID=A0A8H5HV15_9AGAR|nr:hypothetical protein D9757_013391 [Collybiopsis confluens]KAF5389995.1 hypothetical protein D9757_003906 [Collybiopsis confluens]